MPEVIGIVACAPLTVSDIELSIKRRRVGRGSNAEVDYGSIIKTYGHTELEERRLYSPPEAMAVERVPVPGAPSIDLISTSYLKNKITPCRCIASV